MGNQTSHKHIHVRGDSLKVNNMNAMGINSNHATPNSVTSPGGFVYPVEDLNEDYDEAMITPYTKNSYSPTDSVPIFRFPLRTESVSINRDGIAQNIQQQHAHVNEIKKIPVVFKYQAKNCKDVFLVGTFTNWKEKINMIKSDGDFIVIVDLPEGEHQYKFVVDGKWEHDPSQPCVDDTFCGKNNIVVVKKSDFEVMEALTMDSIQQQAQKSSASKNDDLSRSPLGEYTDEIPVRGLNSMSTDKPPYLPPQLLNIVLNKDTSASCEPTLLPDVEPNHVMLKHLYALSIRDGVMVLSSTFRYKHKFITTCFYKPI